MKEENKSLLPLIMTIVICVLILLFITKWSRKNIQTKVKAQSGVKAVKIEQGKNIVSIVKDIEPVSTQAETLQSQTQRIEELLDSQYEAYASHAQQQAVDTEPSKYDIYPSQEELEKIKQDKAIMY